MRIGARTCLTCTCGGTLPIDEAALERGLGGGPAEPARALCQAETARLTAAAAASGGGLIVGCTQEEASFRAALAGAGLEDVDLRLVNIRERAGWSREGAAAGPKIAALLAEAALTREPAPAVTLTSDGVALILGRDETAIEAGLLLADRLDVTVLIPEPEAIVPRELPFPVLKGRVRTAKGHLGAFELTIDGYAAPAPWSRDAYVFEPARDGAASRCDLVLDLAGGAPLFPHRRDGYVRADPGRPAAVMEAALKAGELVGSFDKPRYVRFRPELCAHSRNRRTGCTRCLDVCPTGAITPAGDHVAIDPFICAGCGACASVCPTGAATYGDPTPNALIERVRVLLGTFRAAGGEDPVLLVHEPGRGREMIALLARLGDGLPARAIPFEVGEATELGPEFFAAAMALGAAEVRLLASPRRDDLGPMERLLEMMEAVLEGLGFGAGRCALLTLDDPEALGAALWSMARRPASTEPQELLAYGDRRKLMTIAFEKLHAAAPAPAPRVALPAGAPFGRIEVDAEGCTLCLACTTVCPTEALGDNPDRPQLTFTQDACVQCGLCANTCPEGVISLVPEIDFTMRATRPVVLKDEEPALCIRCGKAFGVRSTIERIAGMLEEKHWMFTGPGSAIERVRMCADCRVVAHVEKGTDPYAGPARPLPATTTPFRGKG